MSESPNLAAALYHARAGRPVFPCSPSTKQPAIAKRDGGNGFKDATTDEATIRAWWARYPDAVPGMPTGARVGVWVFDVDDKPGKVGRDTLGRLCATFGPLPDTVETITATGGSHLFFRHPRDGRLIPNSASMLGLGSETWGRDGFPSVPFEVAAGGKLRVPDLDVRGDGGYVILPGSVMSDGRSYEWEGSSNPDEGAKVAEAPAWLLALVCHDPSAPAAAPASGSAPADAQVQEGGRNDHLYRLGCALRAKGCGVEVIEAALLAENATRCVPPLPEQEVRASAKSAAAKPPGLSPAYEARRQEGGRHRQETQPPALGADGGDALPPLPAGAGSAAPPSAQGPTGGRPQIQVIEGEQPAQIDDAEHYLIQAGAGIYQRGEQGLVRIAAYAGAPNANGVKRPGGVPVIAAVSNDWLVDRMTRDIDWVRWDSRTKELVRRNAPMRVAAGLMARAGEWRFPYLTGFCAAPLLDLDGRLISGPGYDEPTGLYLVDPPTIGAPSTTDRRLAQTSVERVRELLGIGEGLQPERFPFAGPSDVSAALAMVLTALLRPILPTAPICAVSAATPGTGKSLWVDVVSMVATGRAATVVNLGKDEEETEKRIASQLILGEPFSFDNIEGAFRSSALCTAATQESMNVRILSQSRMARVLTRAVIYLTGNNVTPLGDLARRVLLTRLDAGCERPELREFKTDALLRAADNRGQVIGHALRISKAYLDAGCPAVPGAAPYGSFRDWDRMVRFPLMWAGLADPLGRAEDIREGDHSLAGMGLLMQAWQRVRPLPCTAAELYDLIVERAPNFDGHRDGPAYPELHDAAVQVRGDPRKWTARDLGYLLREAQGRPINGLRVVNGGKSKRGVLWEVQPL